MSTLTAVRRFQGKARDSLAEYLDTKGQVIYTPANSLESEILFWGYNPGGNPSANLKVNTTIGEAIERFPEQQCILHKETFNDPDSPYQKGLAALLRAIDHSVLVTNLIFIQTQDVRGLKKQLGSGGMSAHIERCLEVHKEICDIADIKVLITTVGVIRALQRHEDTLEIQEVLEDIPSGMRNPVKIWRATLFEKPVLLIQTPHMSYWGRLTDPIRVAAREEAFEKIGLKIGGLNLDRSKQCCCALQS